MRSVAMDDPFLRKYDPSELEVAAEFLTAWLPFLTRDLCDGCSADIRFRIDSLCPAKPVSTNHIVPTGWDQDPEPSNSISLNQIIPTGWDSSPEPSNTEHKIPNGRDPDPVPEPSRKTWADMAQEEEDELEERESEGEKEKKLSKGERLLQRFRNLKRKKDFVYEESIKGKMVNILSGLELHEGVFSPSEQKRIVDFIYELQEKGRRGELGERTYSEPNKWKRGKGRVTIQFGCNYNYAYDKEGNPPGILRSISADPIPRLFKLMIRRLLRYRVLPPACVPDSCIVNVYEPEDCIPPHIDSHDFDRPFCTVSFLSQCDILFGGNLGIVAPGEFDGPCRIPLPVGSVLVLNGNGADVVKHCVPAVPTKRISITFRKMHASKWPEGFSPEPDLQNIIPLQYDSDSNTSNDEKLIKNSNSGGGINEARTPNSQNNYRRPNFESTSKQKVLEMSSYDGNGEMRTPQGDRSVFNRINEGMGALAVGNSGSVPSRGGRSVFSNNGSVPSRNMQGERSAFGNNGSAPSRNTAQGERSVFGNNSSVLSRNMQGERSVFNRINEGMGALSGGNNGSVPSRNMRGDRSVFNRINEGMGALSGGNNGSVPTRNTQSERSVFSRLDEKNNSYGQSRNSYFRGRINNDRWGNSQGSV